MFVSYGCIKASTLDRWLQINVKSGIKELELAMPLHMEEEYNFPLRGEEEKGGLHEPGGEGTQEGEGLPRG